MTQSLFACYALDVLFAGSSDGRQSNTPLLDGNPVADVASNLRVAKRKLANPMFIAN
jgi:hypothetical protein